MAKTPLTLRVVRLVSQLKSINVAHADGDVTRSPQHASPFSGHPVLRSRRCEPLQPATRNRDDADAERDALARLRRRRVFDAVRARPRGARASPRASRASPRGSFRLALTRSPRISVPRKSHPRLSRASVASEGDGGETAGNVTGAATERVVIASRRSGTRDLSASIRPRRATSLARLARGSEWRAVPRRRGGQREERRFDSRCALPDSVATSHPKPSRLESAAPPTFSEHVSRLRAVRVSVPKPTPRADERWLARRMREVGAARVPNEAAAKDDSCKKGHPLLKTVSRRSSVTFAVTPTPPPHARRPRLETTGPDSRPRATLRTIGARTSDDSNRARRRAETRRCVDRVFASEASAWEVADADDAAAECITVKALRAAAR